jgi:hypothetical protein
MPELITRSSYGRVTFSHLAELLKPFLGDYGYHQRVGSKTNFPVLFFRSKPRGGMGIRDIVDVRIPEHGLRFIRQGGLNFERRFPWQHISSRNEQFDPF